MTAVVNAPSDLFDDLGTLLHPASATGLLTVLVGVAVWVIGREVWGRWRHRRAWAGAARVEILSPPRVDPAGAVAFWQHLLGLLPPRHRAGGGGHVVFEYEFTADGLSISVWVPGTVAAGLVAAAARSAWPGCRTRISPLPRPPTRRRPDQGVCAAGGRLRLARPPGLPIEVEHHSDPIRALIGAAGQPTRGQTGRVQILARPVSGARLAAVAHHRPFTPARLLARALTVGAGAVATLTHEVVSLAVNGPARTRAPRPAVRSGLRSARAPGAGRLVDSAQDRAIAAKAHGSGGGFDTAVRYLATTSHGTGRDEQRAARAGSARRAHALASAFAEFSGHNHYRRRPLPRPARAIEQRRLRGGDPLSVAEVAALAHLPTDDHVPGLRRAGAAAIAPPPQIPAAGPQIRPLGDSDLLADRPVGLAVPDARHHLWVIGATGAGKSTLCVHGVLADAVAGRAAIVLDPKGDLVTDIAGRLPAAARARTVLIDPDHPSPIGPLWPCLNPLTPTFPGGAPSGSVGDVAVENVTTVFSRVFASAWGHRSEDLLRVACLTLRAGPAPASLAQLPALLTDTATRRRAVAHLDPTGRLAEFWAWFDQLADSSRAQVSAPLLNKVRAILLRPFAEALLCGPSTVDLPTLLDTGGLLLVRLPKGALGEDTVRLIGSLLVAQIWQAALARAHQPEHRRRDASLLLDECQNFLHLPYRIEDMLAEARGFRLSITLAHQHLAQLTPALREGVATNARNKVMFAVSPDDAAVLARHTLPELGPHDLAHLDGFHAAAHLLADGAETRAFTLTTRPLPPPPSLPPPRPAPARPPRQQSTRLDRPDPRR